MSCFCISAHIVPDIILGVNRKGRQIMAHAISVNGSEEGEVMMMNAATPFGTVIVAHTDEYL